MPPPTSNKRNESQSKKSWANWKIVRSVAKQTHALDCFICRVLLGKGVGSSFCRLPSNNTTSRLTFLAKAKLAGTILVDLLDVLHSPRRLFVAFIWEGKKRLRVVNVWIISQRRSRTTRLAVTQLGSSSWRRSIRIHPIHVNFPRSSS